MSDNLKTLDRIGPAREEYLKGEGYETFEDLATADHEELADLIQNMPEDTALEIVVQAQNVVDLEESSVEESEPTEEDTDSDDGEDTTDESEDETDSGADTDANTDTESDEVAVELSFETETEYNAFFHTLLTERNGRHRTNRAGAGFYDALLEEMAETTLDGEFVVEVEPDNLNDLHSSIVEQRTSYQGDNLIEMMDAINQVEARLNVIREDTLF